MAAACSTLSPHLSIIGRERKNLRGKVLLRKFGAHSTTYSIQGVNSWRKRVAVEPTGDGIARHPPVLKLSRFAGGALSIAQGGAGRRNPERSRGNSTMAEANGSRTHHRYREITIAGFEDRDDHRTACASVLQISNKLIRCAARAAPFRLRLGPVRAAVIRLGCAAYFG